MARNSKHCFKKKRLRAVKQLKAPWLLANQQALTLFSVYSQLPLIFYPIVNGIK